MWSFFLRYCISGVSTLPSNVVHQALHLHCSIYFWLKSVTHFSGWCCLALLYAPMGIALGLFYSGRGVAIGPNVLWSTPFPAQESTFEVMSREFPWALMWVVLGRHMMLQVECVLHCASTENGIQTKHNMQTDPHGPTHTSQMLVIPISVNKPKFWYLHGSWFWVIQVPSSK